MNVDLNDKTLKVITGALLAWTLLTGVIMFNLGRKAATVDCSACELALVKQKGHLDKCQADLLTSSQKACDEVAKLERERCQDYLKTRQELRCKVCERINGHLPPIVYPPHKLPSDLASDPR